MFSSPGRLESSSGRDSIGIANMGVLWTNDTSRTAIRSEVLSVVGLATGRWKHGASLNPAS